MPKQTGRPPLDPKSPSVAISLRVPAARYDELFALARQRRVSVPEVVRGLLRRAAAIRDDEQE